MSNRVDGGLSIHVSTGGIMLNCPLKKVGNCRDGPIGNSARVHLSRPRMMRTVVVHLPVGWSGGQETIQGSREKAQFGRNALLGDSDATPDAGLRVGRIEQ